jgi:hypothetical protein
MGFDDAFLAKFSTVGIQLWKRAGSSLNSAPWASSSGRELGFSLRSSKRIGFFRMSNILFYSLKPTFAHNTAFRILIWLPSSSGW